MSDSHFEDVLAAMRDGQRFQVGGGRIFRTYAMTEGRLVVIESDDGYTQESPCDEATLRAAMAEVPDGFRKIVDWWKAHRR